MTPEQIFEAATRLGATVLRGPGADVIVFSRAEPAKGDLISIDECARIAGTSDRVVREAIRAGHMPAFGKERDRAVRHADLQAWIETRRYKPMIGPDDADVERWMKKRSSGGKRRK